MIDTPVNGTEAGSQPPQSSTVVAEIPLELGRGDQIVELKLRAPGLIRAAGVLLKTPAVIGSASMRTVEKVPFPVLFAECDPAGELQRRIFLLLPTGQPFSPREGFTVQYRATAFGPGGALHVYEIVEVPS